MIAADLAQLAVPLDDLTLYPGNPRQGDVEAISRSLETFGQRKPIVVNRNRVVLAGNHTVLAARKLGWRELAAVRVDDDETHAAAFSLADNRTAELGNYDTVALAHMIQEVQANDADLLAAISYTADDIDDLLAAVQESTALIEHTDPESRYGGSRAEGSYSEASLSERLEDYQRKGVRSVVLDYPLDEYERVADLSARLRDKWALTSTAELFKELLERASA